MELIPFKSYDRYRDIQRKTERRKSRRPGVKRHEIDGIADWIKENCNAVRFGICHGARYGHEVDWLKVHFRRAEVIGTDLFPKDHPKVIAWDFHKENIQWKNKADFIYSNSLDHSYDPLACLGIWFKQLKSNGAMFLLWHPCQIATHRGDCFGAHFHEYVDLINEVGVVEDIIYQGGLLFTIVARRKDEE